MIKRGGFITQLRSLISLAYTSGDVATPLTYFDIPAYEVNIHCYTYGVYYGDGSNMGAKINVNDVAFFRNVNLKDIFFMNQNAGQNGIIYVVATVPIDSVKAALGV